MSFIHLGADNKVLQESIKHKLEATKVEPCDSKLFDFDDVQYRIFIDPENRSKMIISLETPNFGSVRSHGTEALIQEKLGDYVKEFTDQGCTFEVSLDDEKTCAKAEEISAEFSKLRMLALGGPLYAYCHALQAGKALEEPFDFQFRGDTHIWMVPKSDRVTVIYGFEFLVHADLIIAHQILTEFVDVRRERDVQASPSVSYSKNAPQELRGLKPVNFNPKTFLGYFSILLIASHVKGKKLQTSVENVIGFRAYLTYHIKCAKAFFNQSMRARGKLMLKVLNRARYEDNQKRKQRKIIVSAT